MHLYIQMIPQLFSLDHLSGPSLAFQKWYGIDVVAVFLCVRKVRVGWESAEEKYEM